MDKYKIIKDLGLQVFTQPYNKDAMLVSADDLADVINRCARKDRPHQTIFELIVRKTPKTLEEKILYVLNDGSKSQGLVLQEIRALVEKTKD